MEKDDVEQLLNIANLSRQWPNLAPIHSLAMAKLEDHAKEVKDQNEKKKVEDMKAEAAKQAAAEATAKPKEQPSWRDQSSPSSAPTPPSPRPLVRPAVE